MKIGRERRQNRKSRQIEALAAKPEREPRIFSAQSEAEFHEDSILLARAVNQKWDVPAETKARVGTFVETVMDSPEATAETQLRVFNTLVQIDRLRLNEAKAKLLIRDKL